MNTTNQLQGPFYVAKYNPSQPIPHDESIRDPIAVYDAFEDAVIGARKLCLGSALHTKHACVYVEHDQRREMLWASA